MLALFQARSQQLAFPTAEGYGKYTVGGRGGEVFEVTNLDNSGEGSLREALEAEGPRTVVFRISGTIEGNFSIKNDSITIAGQTAPGDGICIKGNLSIGADNIIIRYIRVRFDPAMGENDGIGGRYHKNIIFDHISASWSTDETMTLYHNENTTVQWCIIAEACPKGTTEEHRFGGIWGNNYGTWHHNLFAHNSSRNPRWASGSGFNDYRNNVVYNWVYASSYGGEAHQVGDRRKPPIEHSTINMIANYYKLGPATESKVNSIIVAPSTRDGDADAGKWWVSENFVEGSPNVTQDNLLGVTQTSSAFRLNEPWPAMKIEQETAKEAFQSVLDHAGCSFPKRDKVDADIIDDVLNGTAKYGNKGIIDKPSDVGGWPELKSYPAPIDTDHDGMPDDWEDKNDLDKSNPEDRNNISSDGYTMLEIYLNSIK
ncbi:pectate lyase [Algoriphagus sp. SE2]|uniref:pectate lyase family protein n=1 Tax=Algoriphagus sp. SE2 TaxID=3141536 RepID=UPI0031CD58DF